MANFTQHLDSEVDGCPGYYPPPDWTLSTNETLLYSYVPVACIPVLVVLCTVGNALNVWILSWHCPPGLKKILLLSMALSDTIVIWSAVPRYLNLNSAILGIDLGLPKWHFLIASYGFFTWLQYTFTYVSDWILVTFSLERLFIFRYKKTHHLHKTDWRPAVCLIAVFIIISGVTTSGELVWYYHWWYRHNQRQDEGEPAWITHWIRTQEQIDIVLPIVLAFCLLGINAWLLIYLKRQMSIRKSLLATTGNSTTRTTQSRSSPTGLISSLKATGRDSRRGDASSTSPPGDNLTRMLLGCVVLYFVTQLPAVILTTLEHLSKPPFCLFQLRGKEHWKPVVATLALVNYAVNFFVYMGMSAKFRTTACLLFHGSRMVYGTFRSRSLTVPETRATSIFSASWKKSRVGGDHESYVTLLQQDSLPRRWSHEPQTVGRSASKPRTRSLVPSRPATMANVHFTVENPELRDLELCIQRKSL